MAIGGGWMQGRPRGKPSKPLGFRAGATTKKDKVKEKKRMVCINIKSFH